MQREVFLKAFLPRLWELKDQQLLLRSCINMWNMSDMNYRPRSHSRERDMKFLYMSECQKLHRGEKGPCPHSPLLVQVDIQDCYTWLQQSRHGLPPQLVTTDTDKATKAIVSLGKQVALV